MEFASEADVDNILSASSHVGDPQAVPVHSQFLWFRAANHKLAKLKNDPNAILNVENGTQVVKNSEIIDELRKCDSVSDQMLVLYNKTRINDIGTRLRFLTCYQIENAIQGMFPNASAIPFGSSVNGCGKMECDLDLVLRLSDEVVGSSKLELLMGYKIN